MSVPKRRIEPPKIEASPVQIVTDPPRTRDVPQTPASAPRVGPFNRPIDIRLSAPEVSDHLPPVDVTHGPPLDSLLLNSGGARGGGDPRERIGRLDLLGDTLGAREWRGTEALMRVITQAKPRYPERLRQAAIEGRVLVRFKVDTLGLIDQASVTILSSTHDLFSRAVRDALGGFRFKPAEVNGHRVVALAEMPFEFAIGR
jgi:TonB family protein